MFWKVTLPSALIFLQKLFFTFTYRAEPLYLELG